MAAGRAKASGGGGRRRFAKSRPGLRRTRVRASASTDAQPGQHPDGPGTPASSGRGEQPLIVRLAESAARLGSTPAVRMLMNSLVGGSVIGNVIILAKWYGSRNKESGRLEQRQQRYDAAADIVLGKQTGGGQDSLEAKVSRIDRDLRGDPESISDDERLGVKGKLKQVDTNIKQMDTNMKQMETSIKQMDTNMKQMDTTIKQMDTKIKQMDTNMIVFGTAISLCVGSIAYLNWKSGSGRQGESG